MIGVLGGTFDPIHYGHLRPAQEVQQALGLREVRFIPAAIPPHRPSPAASAEQRLEMVRLAIADQPGWRVDDRELKRGGPSYTVPTLESLRAELGEATPLCLLIGADAFWELETWHRWQQLPALAHLVVMNRPGSRFAASMSEVPAWARQRLCRERERLARTSAGYVWLQRVTPQDISATRIRAAIAAGEPVTDWLPPAVWDYIRRNHLYSAKGA